VGYPTLRRLYLAQRRAAIGLGNAFSPQARFWQWKQERIPWPPLPATFPARSKLIAQGYTTVRDLDGADADELIALGLTRPQAQAVLAAMESWKMIPTILKNYVRQDGRGTEVYDAPLMGPITITATTTGDTYEMGDLDALRLNLDVTAASGSNPTLDVTVETSPDGVNWQPFMRFAQKTAVSSERRQGGPSDRYVRAVATVGGTNPSFTFSLGGEAV